MECLPPVWRNTRMAETLGSSGGWTDAIRKGDARRARRPVQQRDDHAAPRPPLPAPAPQSSAESAAGAIDATKIYGRGNQVIALDNVTVAFEKAKYTAIMGPSGSGKSTLMHCLAGLDTLTSGAVYIGDTYLAKLNDKELTELRRRAVGFIFQAYNLIPTLSAEENINLPLLLGGQTVTSSGSTRSSAPSGSPTACATARASCRVASSSVSPSPGRSTPPRRRLRRRADRQPRLRDPAPRSSTSCRACGSTGRRSSWSPTIRTPRPTPTASCSSTTARSSTSCSPRRRTPLDRVKRIGD